MAEAAVLDADEVVEQTLVDQQRASPVARAVLYAMFVLSGAAGLIYESIWSRYLALFVGNSAYAQVLVLTIFLGGMAVGAMLVGRRSEELALPLAWYALAELLVGVLGLVFHSVFVNGTRIAYDSVFPLLTGSPVLLVGVKWGLAALLILPQSILLGTTFPLMSAGILRQRHAEAGRVLSWLYASNSFGAAGGVLVAGFYLVGRFGLPGTLVAAAILNLVVALLTALLVAWSRRESPDVDDDAVMPADALIDYPEDPWPALRSLLLAVTFGTAVASLVYEIAWIRMLSLVLGSATHSFELMLSAFILGLGLGSLWMRGRADGFRDPVRALGFVQCAMGVLAVATLPLYIASFTWTAALLTAFTKTAEGYVGFTISRYAICVVIMVPATFFAGMTLPLITRLLYRAGAEERAIGEVYAFNTAGSIVGVQLAGLVLMPVLGVKYLIVAAAGVDVLLGVVLLYAAARRRGTSFWPYAVAAGIAALILYAGSSAANFDRNLLASGVFRDGKLPARGDYATTFYHDGRTATVGVRRTAVGDLILTTNGKPDASVMAARLSIDSVGPKLQLTEDDATQILLPVIGLAHAPGALAAAVIGQGSGVTSHMLLGSPLLREVVTIEIEPEMIRGSQAFYPLNRRVFEDPRAQFVLDDAKSYFAASGRRFDLIISEPSNPWVSGVSGLFTAEFYHRVRRSLTPNGVFAQWMHLYESNDALVRSVLAALQASFPTYDIFLVGDADIVLIATAGTLPDPDWSVVDFPGIKQDLARTLPLTPHTLDALRIASSRALGPFVTTARPNSDFMPVVDLGGERARFLELDAAGLRSLNVFSFDIGAALSNRRSPFSTESRPAVNADRIQSRARSALLRGVPVEPGSLDDPLLAPAFTRQRSFEAFVRSGRTPTDWHAWVHTLSEVDRDVHGGSAGVVDSSLYLPLDGYLRGTNAPAAVRSAVTFLRALDAWDFVAASRAADELIEALRRGESWISVDYLRDGAVVAKLKTGDVKGALTVFEHLLPLARRDAVGTFRTRLLAAQIAVAMPPKEGQPVRSRK